MLYAESTMLVFSRDYIMMLIHHINTIIIIINNIQTQCRKHAIFKRKILNRHKAQSYDITEFDSPDTKMFVIPTRSARVLAEYPGHKLNASTT